MKRGVYSRVRSGFALPTILVASTVMLIILVATSTTNVAMRSAILDVYYDRLAKTAAEAGLARAHECLRSNNYVAEWGEGASGKPLTASTNCDGSIRTGCDSGCAVLDTDRVTTDFSSTKTVAMSDGSTSITVIGTVELRRAVGDLVWRTYSHTLHQTERYAKQPQLGAGAGWGSSGHIGFMTTLDGQLYGFGDNQNQQISDSDESPIVRPILMKLPAGVDRVKSLVTSGQGASIICIIGSDDQAYCRGKPGADGELGLLDYSAEGWQRFVIPGSSTKMNSISVMGQGGDTACVITEYQRQYCAGENYLYDGDYGLLGSGNTTTHSFLISNAVKFQIPGDLAVRVGYNQDRYICAITFTDELYCAGNNTYGTLGDGGNQSPSTPIKYTLPGGRKPVNVVSSYHEQTSRILHVLANDGTIWGSGRNTYGELGNGTATVQRTPVQFGTRTDYISMLSSQRHMCGITSAGEVYCAGDNTYGQLGDGTCTNSPTPVRFNLPSGEKARQVIVGQNQHQSEATIILTESGNIYSAGKDPYGRFGTGSIPPGPNYALCAVVKTVMPTGVRAQTLSTNDARSTYFMGTDGRPYGMGYNNQGQLGNGTTTNSSKPRSALLPRSGILF